MQSESKIHLVIRPEPLSAGIPQAPATGRQKQRKKKPKALDPRDIVRETLAIARNYGRALTTDLPNNRLLVELVASLAVARLKKGGIR